MVSKPREVDMYPHIKAWLEEQGYDVYAEVKNCDIVAAKDDRLVLIEIKRTVNMELVHQIIRRQAADGLVYGAVLGPKEIDKKWQGHIRLFKRLGAGMLLVYMEPEPRVVQLLAPSLEERPTRKNVTKTLWREISGRSVDVNVGGSPGWNNMDSYKEKALRIAVAIERLGPSPKHVLALTGASAMTGSILRRNKDGWFERVGPGLYGLTEDGRDALEQYGELASSLRQVVTRIPRP